MVPKSGEKNSDVDETFYYLKRPSKIFSFFETP